MIDDFADSYALGRDAGAVHRVQPAGQVPRPAGDRARPRRRRAGHRPLCRIAPPGRRIARAGLRRRCRARPELFPVRHHARAARLPALSAGRHDQGRGARAGARASASSRRQARQPGHLLRAARAAIPTSSTGCGRTRWSPARSSIIDGRVLGRHQGIIHYTVGQRRGLGIAVRRAALRGAARRRPAAASWSARARRC